MGLDMTVSHWRWRVDSLDTGAGIQLGQCKPIIRIISIIVPCSAINCLHEVCSNVNIRMYNFVVLNIYIYNCIFLLLTYESPYIIVVLCGRCSVLDHL